MSIMESGYVALDEMWCVGCGWLESGVKEEDLACLAVENGV